MPAAPRFELGLIGKPLEHSFSPAFFERLWKERGLSRQGRYRLFELDDIGDLPGLLERESLLGFNVTLPFKQSVLPFLDALDAHARSMGSVNTVLIKGGILMGFNTDWIGFQQCLRQVYPGTLPQNALVLGTGGASKAVCYALGQWNIPFEVVSRSGPNDYESLKGRLGGFDCIVHCTPLGTYPRVSESPPLPYNELHPGQRLIDLVYNPPTTRFMHEGIKRGLKAVNGQSMLEAQALEAWKIWERFAEI